MADRSFPEAFVGYDDAERVLLARAAEDLQLRDREIRVSLTRLDEQVGHRIVQGGLAGQYGRIEAEIMQVYVVGDPVAAGTWTTTVQGGRAL